MSFLVKSGTVSKIILSRTLDLAWSRGGRGPSCLHLIVLLPEMEEFLISFLEKRELSKNATASGAFVNFLQELVNSDKLIGPACGMSKTSSSVEFFDGSPVSFFYSSERTLLLNFFISDFNSSTSFDNRTNFSLSLQQKRFKNMSIKISLITF